MAIVSSSPQSSISDDFLRLASEAIRNKQSSEGALRTAISRAYYAVYLTARDRLFGPDETGLTRAIRKRLQKRFQKAPNYEPGSHNLVIFAITDTKSTGMLPPLVLSQQVSQLKEARVHADYYFTPGKLKDIEEESWREYAERSIALASQLLPVTRKLPSYHPTH